MPKQMHRHDALIAMKCRHVAFAASPPAHRVLISRTVHQFISSSAHRFSSLALFIGSALVTKRP